MPSDHQELLLTRGTLDSGGFALVPALLCLQADGVLGAWIQPSQQEGGAVHRDLQLTLFPGGSCVNQAVAVELGNRPSPAKGQSGLSGLADFQVLGVIKIYRAKKSKVEVSLNCPGTVFQASVKEHLHWMSGGSSGPAQLWELLQWVGDDDVLLYRQNQNKFPPLILKRQK